VDLSKIGRLTFERPDLKKFPCLELAREAAKAAGTAPAVLCASDEEAVRHYLEGKIKLSGIAKTVEKVLKRHKNIAGRELVIYDVLEADRWARQETRSICCH
jgi:1-deoxy-D-xylulose-5-phosphate reductoisomerase